MNKIAVISGTGFYDFLNQKECKLEEIATNFGAVQLEKIDLKDISVYHLSRHEKGHFRLPNHINYQANMLALKQIGVELVIATSVMGVLDDKLELGRLVFFDDMLFFDNRLPDGSLCTIHTKPGEKMRGHYIFSTPFSIKGRQFLIKAARSLNIPYVDNRIYAHVNGPRFNSKAECAALKKMGADLVSQTSGPEIVLAGELELPYVLIGYGVDYANGVKEEPTPVEVLDKNIEQSKEVFKTIVLEASDLLSRITENLFDNGLNYRFDFLRSYN